MSIRIKWFYSIVLFIIALIGYYFRLEVMEWYKGVSPEEWKLVVSSITVGIGWAVIWAMLWSVFGNDFKRMFWVILWGVLGFMLGLMFEGIIKIISEITLDGMSFALAYCISYFLVYLPLYLIKKSKKGFVIPAKIKGFIYLVIAILIVYYFWAWGLLITLGIILGIISNKIRSVFLEILWGVIFCMIGIAFGTILKDIPGGLLFTLAYFASYFLLSYQPNSIRRIKKSQG